MTQKNKYLIGAAFIFVASFICGYVFMSAHLKGVI